MLILRRCYISVSFYDRQSEKMLKNLKEIAEFEGYMDGAKEEFAALETKLTHKFDHELTGSRKR